MKDHVAVLRNMLRPKCCDIFNDVPFASSRFDFDRDKHD